MYTIFHVLPCIMNRNFCDPSSFVRLLTVERSHWHCFGYSLSALYTTNCLFWTDTSFKRTAKNLSAICRSSSHASWINLRVPEYLTGITILKRSKAVQNSSTVLPLAQRLYKKRRAFLCTVVVKERVLIRFEVHEVCHRYRSIIDVKRAPDETQA